eukprot:403333506
MDFKTRFQGKTSMITKDGGIETAISMTNVPINKVDIASISNNNFNKQGDQYSQGITYGANSQSNGFNNGFSSQSTSFGIGGGINNTQQKQQTQFNQNPQFMNSTANSNHSYFSKAGINGNQGQINGGGNDYQSYQLNDLEDLHADNIYLKGGQNMAEALQKRNNSSTNDDAFGQTNQMAQNTAYSGFQGGANTGMSIAMRMKRNREAQLGLINNQNDNNQTNITNNNQVHNNHPNPFSNINNNGINQNQAMNINSEPNWTLNTNYSNNSLATNNQTPIMSSQSQRPQNINQNNLNYQTPTPGSQQTSQYNTITAGNNSSSKPPSSQNLRKSVEKQRHNNFANVTKQIITTSSISNGKLLLNKQQSANSNNNETSQFRRMNQNQQSDQTYNNLQVKHRAASVSNPIQQYKQHQIQFDEDQTQNNSETKTLIKPRTQGFRSAGLRSQQQQNAKGKVQQLQDKSPQQQNSNENPYQANNMVGNNTNLHAQVPMLNGLQNMQNPISGQNIINPDQLKQQILMMQQQMLMLQQQQQFIYGANINNLPPQSSPVPIRQDIYKQFELADQKYLEKNKPLTGISNTNYQSSQSNGSQVRMTSGGGQTQATTTTGSIYKPYTVKEYKQMVTTQQSSKLGGLGANIGGEDWEKAKRKQEQAAEYARQLKLQNMAKPPAMKRNMNDKPKEKTSRDKAIEFSKNLSKPKLNGYKANSTHTSSNNLDYDNMYGADPYGQQSQSSQYLNNDLNGIEEDDENGYDDYGNTLKGTNIANDFAQLDLRNQQYATELEEIKQMIM